jgi:hypothetical protein
MASCGCTETAGATGDGIGAGGACRQFGPWQGGGVGVSVFALCLVGRM